MSVIIFMYWQTAARLAGTNVLPGFASSSGCSIPVSVATMNVSASERLAWASIPPVESMCVFSTSTSPDATYSMTDVEQPHSGWIRKSAPGCCSRTAAMSAGRMPACTWHSPTQTLSLRPTIFST